MNKIKEILEDHFPHFEAELKTEIAETCQLKTFEPESQIMDSGQAIAFIPLIYDGNVKIYREDDEGHELFLYYMEPGEACAISMICSTREKMSHIKAVSLQESHAIMIPIDHMDSWIRKYPTWYYFVMETYQMRMEELLSAIDDIAFKRLDERLLEYLRKNAESQNSWELHTNHQTIATELNTSREVVSRLLKKLEQRGAVELSRNRVKLIDPFIKQREASKTL